MKRAWIVILLVLGMVALPNCGSAPEPAQTPETALYFDIEVLVGCVDKERNNFALGTTCTGSFVPGYRIMASAEEGFYVEAGDRTLNMVEGGTPNVQFLIAEGEQVVFEARSRECKIDPKVIVGKGGKDTIVCDDNKEAK